MKRFIAFLVGLCIAQTGVGVAQDTTTAARVAVARSIPLLQKADVESIQKSGCVSCHHTSLTAMTVSLARKNGFSIDEQTADRQLKASAKYMADWRERITEGFGIPGFQDTVSFILVGLSAEGYMADQTTTALAQFLRSRQRPDGHWPIRANRPPMEYSDVTVTATSIRALQRYAPVDEKLEYDLAVRKAAEWLTKAPRRSSEEHAWRLLALVWTGMNKEIVQGGVGDLIAEQRDDGGWSQLPAMKSDAYATGQALVALHEAGVSVKDSVYQRGVQFLLSTQLEDGSWFVKSRAIPIQPYFESGFPHGEDQWISAAASNWATMALILAGRREN